MSATGKVSLEQLAKDITECKRVIQRVCLPIIEEAELFINEVNEPAEPELIQGYTAEQWQEIIDGGYLCEFWGGCYPAIEAKFGILEDFTTNRNPFDGARSSWSFCRPAQIKGVMRPIFVRPTDSNVMVCLFTKDNYPVNGAMHRMSFGRYCMDFVEKYQDVTKYIEL